MAAFATGCASVDPTDPSHFSDVEVWNDTPARVVIVQCDTSCGTLHDREQVPPGQRTIVNISHEGFDVGYAVESASEQRLGCLYMRLNGPPAKRPVFRVSSMKECR
jgi:hypothetical protein